MLENKVGLFAQKKVTSTLQPHHTNSITVRSILETEIPALINIAKQIYKETHQRMTSEEKLNQLFNADNFKSILTSPNYIFFAVFDQNQMVGYAKLNINPTHSSQKEYAILENFCILNAFKPKAHSFKLMQNCFLYAIAEGKTKIKLFILEKNSQIDNFYRIFGFNKTGKPFPTLGQPMICHDIKKYTSHLAAPSPKKARL